ncbi:hypothetical protein [Mycobacterium sp. GA-1199]|uniref:hypothetical protein n=1 Tax=Mycobacterium sp. GA-1199 TaxID=1772287 RepID=UPI000AD17B64|nr:hypothetical protein [Mycobacterium sp. GA-1199]
MGIWEEAQAQYAQQQAARVAGAQMRQARVADSQRLETSQARAVGEFIEAMNRLGIKPCRHSFIARRPKNSWPSGSALSGVTGWAIYSHQREWPAHGKADGSVKTRLKRKIENDYMVVSTEGQLYRLEVPSRLSSAKATPLPIPNLEGVLATMVARYMDGKVNNR